MRAAVPKGERNPWQLKHRHQKQTWTDAHLVIPNAVVVVSGVEGVMSMYYCDIVILFFATAAGVVRILKAIQ